MKIWPPAREIPHSDLLKVIFCGILPLHSTRYAQNPVGKGGGGGGGTCPAGILLSTLCKFCLLSARTLIHSSQSKILFPF